MAGKHLQGSPLALVVWSGPFGLLWAAAGLSQAVRATMNEAWNVPEHDRPGFGPRLVRALG